MTLVSEAMNRSVVAVPPEARAVEAAALARHTHAEHLVVLDAGNLVGILCSVCDLEGVDPDEEVLRARPADERRRVLDPRVGRDGHDRPVHRVADELHGKPPWRSGAATAAPTRGAPSKGPGA